MTPQAPGNTIKERPILFSGPMVRAILDGRKTQTRRLIKPPPPHWHWSRVKEYAERDGLTFQLPGRDYWVKPPPYGKPGDRLWVRETWSHTGAGVWTIADARKGFGGRPIYRADGGHSAGVGWWPSIHMPREFSRITLEITSVDAERLQEITTEDAKAEGLACLTKDDGQTWKYGIADRDGWPGKDDDGWHWHEWDVNPVAAYKRLWEQINGAGSWAANPWVWVIEFKADRLREEIP